MDFSITEPIGKWVPLDRGEKLLPWDAEMEGSEKQGSVSLVQKAKNFATTVVTTVLPNRPPSYVRVSSDATAYAKENRYPGAAGLCLYWVRTCLNIEKKYSDAKASWLAADNKHYNSPPPEGAPFWYQVGLHWHVVLADKRGMVWSTDSLVKGRADLVSINAPVSSWGAQRLGWAESLNGVRCVPVGIILDASQVQEATITRSDVKHGRILKRWVWSEVKGTKGAKRMNLLTSTLGTNYRSNARLIQKMLDLNTPHDGVLGVDSLNWLAQRHSEYAVVVS